MEIKGRPSGLRGHVAGLLFPLLAIAAVLALGRLERGQEVMPAAALELPVLSLHLKFEDLQRLGHKRKEALARGLLFASSDDFVPARAMFEGEEHRVSVRLKGDLVDHLHDEDSWSLRVRVKNGGTLSGMGAFSLHRPAMRMGAAEWFVAEVLRSEGILAPRYDFVRVELDGRPLGVYAREEHFTRHLVEHQGRREGPIVRFNESAYWAELALQVPAADLAALDDVADDRLRSASADWQAALIDGFGEGKARRDPAAWARWVDAVQALQGFRDGLLPPDQVFDLPRVARFIALAEVLNGYHGLMWHNVRFYADPVTGRLEPIGFDAEAETDALAQPLVARLDNERSGTPPWIRTLIADEAFEELWMAELNRLVEPGVLEGWLERHGPQLDSIEATLGATTVHREAMLRRRDLVRSLIRPAFAAVAHRTVDPSVLAVASVGYVPLRIVRAGCAEAERPVAPQRLGGRPRYARLDYVDVALAEPLGDCDAAVIVELLGRAEGRRVPVHAWAPAGAEIAAEAQRRSPAAHKLPPFVRSLAGAFEVAEGQWRVDEDMIVPAGSELRIAPGAVLDLVDGASILSYSPVSLRGTRDVPIGLTSSDASGGGLTVISDQRSTLEHVVIEDQGAPDGPGPGMTGATTFYGGAVTMRAVTFEGARAEDALNLVRTTYDLSDVRFAGSAGDSLDIDFGDGRLAELRFERCGNDCLDVSGTELQLDGVTVAGAADKGISVGEGSRVQASGVRISGAHIGVAVKDLSELRVVGLSIAEGRYGVAAYQKKPEFGPGLLEASHVSLGSVETAHLVEEGSRVMLDGQMIAGTGARVAAMLEGTQ